jgi:hypothetical protein
VVGIPEITPVLDSDKPASSAPDATDHLYGELPPLTASVCE